MLQGTTNLPEGTKLGVELMKGDMGGAQDFKIFVASGAFHSAAFRNGASPLPPGKQKVHVFTFFNKNWQSEANLKVIG